MRSTKEQLQTAYWLLAMFNMQLSEFEQSGKHSDRIDQLREGKATWEQRIRDLGGELPDE